MKKTFTVRVEITLDVIDPKTCDSDLVALPSPDDAVELVRVACQVIKNDGYEDPRVYFEEFSDIRAE